MNFSIDKAIIEKHSDICIGAVIAEGIDNTKDYPELSKMLLDQVNSVHLELAEKRVKELDFLQPYRECMETLGVNKNKYPCSIEAILTRIAKKPEFPIILPVVDIGNYVSLKYKIPIGAHDRDSFITGDKSGWPAGLTVRFSTEADLAANTGPSFDDFSAGEPVYASGNSIRTRRWIWRQPEAGKIASTGRNFVFPLDGFTCNLETVIKARDELAVLVKQFFSCNVRTGMLDKNNLSMGVS